MHLPAETHARRSPRPARRFGVLVKAGVLVLAAVVVAQPSAWAARSVLPTPQAPVAQPAEAEAPQPYVGQSSCAPFAKSGVRKFRDLILDTYGRGSDGGTKRACNVGSKSEHKEGRAWDWMVNASVKKDKRVADKVIAWLLADGPDGQTNVQARRLGVMYIIWNGRIWGSYNDTWKQLSAGSHQHTDHVHFSFSWAGATGKTSFWSGQVRNVDYGPCPVYAGQPAVIRTKPNPVACSSDTLLTPPTTRMPLLWFGSVDQKVRWAQRKLGVNPTGRFNAATRRAVAAYQVGAGLPRTGALDQPTWAKIRPKSVIAAEPVAPTVPGPVTPVPEGPVTPHVPGEHDHD
jgi:peptidoglycan hydrolase-like protein with peptidoglycan-binding domain